MSGKGSGIPPAPNRDKGKPPKKRRLQLNLNRRPDDQTERKSGIPPAPNRDKGKAPQKPSLQLDLNRGPDDQTERKWPGPSPNPRLSYLLLGPEEGGYATRALAPPEVDPANPVLRISNEYKHFVFLDIPSSIDIAGSEDSARYRVLDVDKRAYEIAFSRISHWERTVKDLSLRAGDEVSFERYLDTSFYKDFYYLLKYVIKQSDGGKNDDARKEDKGKQKVSGPSKPEFDKISADTPSTGQHVLNVIYPRIVLKKIPDQEEGNVHGPGSRDFPPHAYCFRKTVNFFEVPPIVAGAKLFLSFTDAVILTDNPRIGEVRPVGKYSKDIKVYDGDNHPYIMTLNTHFSIEGSVRFDLGGEWDDFATKYKLKHSDEVMIYKILDRSVSVGYYHVIRHVSKKLPDDVEIMNDSVRAATGSGQRRNITSADACDQRRNTPSEATGGQRRNITSADACDGRRTILAGPDSSFYCTTKTLRPRDVSETDPRLHLDALSEAVHLCKVPSPAPYPLGRDPKTLLVFDMYNNPYRMSLSHYDNGDGGVTYTLGGDWQKFIRARGLRANDEITILRYWIRSLQEDYYIFKNNTITFRPAEPRE